MMVGDKVVVKAEATGLGKEMKGIVDKIETFLGTVLVSVNYTSPTAISGYGGTFVEGHVFLDE